MTDRKFILPALAGVLGLSTLASAAEPTAAELKAQIEALQGQVEKIEARQASASEQSATVQSVIEDAQRRSQLLQTGALTAGWDGRRFFISSQDGNFTISPVFQFQLRNATNYRDEGGAGDDSDLENGFEIRRMKIGVQGNLFTKDLAYKFLWQSSRNGGGVFLEEAWARYSFADGWSIRGGQYKDPLNRESMTSSISLLSTERSYQTDIFYGSDNFIQGVSLIYDDNDMPIKAEVAFTDGAVEANNNFRDPPAGDDANFGVAGRLDYLVFGDWKHVNNFSATKIDKDSLVLGIGADFTQAEVDGGPTENQYRYTADALLKLAAKWSLYAALNGRNIEGDGNSNDIGGLLQASYAISDHWEPFVRYGYTYFDDAPAGLDNTVHEITAGVNYYYYGQNAKFTVDASYLPNGATFSDSGADILAGDASQIVLRAQFQLAL